LQGRLRLALALCRPAQALLLDEPLSGVDLQSRDAIVRILVAHVADASVPVVIATHEIREVERLVDRVVVLAEGRVCCDEEADAVRQRVGTSLEDWVRGGVTI